MSASPNKTVDPPLRFPYEATNGVMRLLRKFNLKPVKSDYGIDCSLDRETTEAQREQLYRNYISSSSFPYAINLSGGTDLRQYLQGVYNTVILKDIMQRRRLQDSDILERTIRYLADNIGNVASLKSIADTLTSSGRRCSPHTIENCVDGLLGSYMFYCVSRYDVHGKEHLRVGNKYYMVDVGLRNLLLGIRPNDFGHILENVVYLELRRRGNQVFVGKVGKQEVNFVCLNGGDRL